MFHSRIDSIFFLLFRTNDSVAGFLAKRLSRIKMSLLLIAHLSLLGFFFPEMRREFGELSANLLIIILFIGPLAKIFRIRLLALLLGLRRELGILMGYLATVHGLGYVLDPQWFSFVIASHWSDDVFGINRAILFGMLAYVLMLPLLLTSNTLMTRLLGGVRWKRLHRLVYALFFAAIAHRFLIKGARGDVPEAFFQAGVLVFAYLSVQLLAWKNIFRPLRATIGYVEERHKRYLMTKTV